MDGERQCRGDKATQGARAEGRRSHVEAAGERQGRQDSDGTEGCAPASRESSGMARERERREIRRKSAFD